MKVEPVRDREIVARIADVLASDHTRQGERRYLLWLTGIYTGRRVSDILGLKVRDVRGRTYINIKEQKTGKRAEIYVPRDSELYSAYLERLADRDPDEYVFCSPSADPATGKQRPINRRTAYRDIQSIKDMVGLDENLGTHTMRKTFGYWYYQDTQDIGGLMDIYNHSSEAITKIYIGIAADDRREAYRKISAMYRKRGAGA